MFNKINTSKRRLNASGFSILEIILVIAVILAIGVAGWALYLANHNKTSDTTDSSNSSSSTGALTPSQVGDGMCQAYQVKNYVYGQIAIAGNATCNDVNTVANAAANANYESFSSDGYKCTPKSEGSGSEWSSSWSSTYYAYSCVDGSKQLAFNFGPVSEYTYGESSN